MIRPNDCTGAVERCVLSEGEMGAAPTGDVLREFIGKAILGRTTARCASTAMSASMAIGRSEVEVVRAVLDDRANAGAIGSPFWKTVREERLVPEGALTEIWTSPPYNHCMFTARPDFEPELERRFAEALSRMSYDNPRHRAVLEAEGLRRWIGPELDGYHALREASQRQGFFKRN
jgi:ABC-type phosphate/phosphonate transport system substrate-binding protein